MVAVAVLTGLVLVPMVRAAEPASRAGAATTRASVRAASSGPGRLTSASDELAAQFVEAVKRTREYRRAKELDPATVRAAAAEWEKELGVKINTVAEPFLTRSMQRRRAVFRLADGSSVEPAQYSNPETPVLLRHEQEEGQGGAIIYSVRREQLKDLEFETVPYLTIVDPANEVKERFTAQNESLTSLVERLCQEGNLEYSFRADLANEAKLSLDVRNKSTADRLRIVAKAAGFDVTFERTIGSRAPERMPHFVEDTSVSTRVFGAVAEAVEGGRAIDELRGDVLRAAKHMGEMRPVVVLEPRLGAVNAAEGEAAKPRTGVRTGR